MTVAEQIEILQAYKRGEEIEWRKKYSDMSFVVLNDKNHDFNFEHFEYRIKPKRWRAEKEDNYYYITSIGEVDGDIEDYDLYDKSRYLFGNYFQTKEQAKEASELVKETLIKFHEGK